jgi:hypothetical protein
MEATNDMEVINREKFIRIIVGVKGRKNVELFQSSFFLIAARRQWFGRKSQGDVTRASGGIGKLAKSMRGCSDGIHGCIVNSSNEGANILVMRDTGGATQLFFSRCWKNLRAIGTVGSSVSGKMKAKGRGICARDRDTKVAFGSKWSQSETKGWGQTFNRLGWQRRIILYTLEVLDIQGWVSIGEIIHTLVKVHMKSNFDSFGIQIIPQNVIGGIRQKTKEDAFASMKLQFSGLRA